MGKNRVRLSLFGTDYVISSDENEEYIRKIGGEVEKRISLNMQDNARISVLMSAVLTALDYCDEAKKANLSADHLRSQIKDYLEESSKARMEADDARREIERMKREIQTLRLRLAENDSAAQAARQTPPAAQAQQVLPGRTVAPPAPISHPAPVSRSVPPQARLFTRPQPVDSEADDEVMSCLTPPEEQETP